jgi:hypothetical protein
MFISDFSFSKSLKALVGITVFLLASNSFGQTSNSDLIENVSSQIESLRIKRDWAKSTPKEDSIAIAQGWYEKVEIQLAELFDKKRNLIKTETGKRWVSIEEFEAVLDKKKSVLLADENYIIEQNQN